MTGRVILITFVPMHASSIIIIRNVLIFIAILIAIDLYAFRGVRTAFSFIQSTRAKQLINWGYWFINVSLIVGIVYAFVTFDKHAGPDKKVFGLVGGLIILFLIPKLVILIVMLLEDVYRGLFALGLFFGRLFGAPTTEEVSYFVGRRQFLSQLALGIAAIPFLSILYGITKGKYNYKVHKVNLKFKDLPNAFNGLTITQLSDIHVGSFDSEEQVKHGIQIANEQNSDLLFFTGDLVNNLSSEMDDWVETFKQLKAPMGMYSILGNHDYGDYTEWNSAEEKTANLDRLKSIHSQLGFRLLLNENVNIEKNGQKITLVGVENWGTGGFAKYGDLNKSLNGVDPNSFKILLSHDPSHWDAQTIKHKEHIHLTLAGHTHGMQFGVEIPGINLQWSPVKYRYPRWAGLYEEAGKYLYVNRGFGFIGFPGRIGMLPEITVTELVKG